MEQENPSDIDFYKDISNSDYEEMRKRDFFETYGLPKPIPHRVTQYPPVVFSKESERRLEELLKPNKISKPPGRISRLFRILLKSIGKPNSEPAVQECDATMPNSTPKL